MNWMNEWMGKTFSFQTNSKQTEECGFVLGFIVAFYGHFESMDLGRKDFWLLILGANLTFNDGIVLFFCCLLVCFEN